MTKFDELNKLKRYYSIMEIPQSEKDKRVSLGNFLYDAFLYVFLLMRTEAKIKGIIDKDYYIRSLEGRITDVLDDNGIPYEENYIPTLAKEVIETTARHLDEDYYFSQERALLVAQNESSTIYNTIDYMDAKTQGKKYKRWVAELDNATRPWHVDVDGTKIPIDDMFQVGTDSMRFPHDYANGSPENLVNCRCTCLYE